MARKIILTLFLLCFCGMLVFFLPVQIRYLNNLLGQKYTTFFTMSETVHSSVTNSPVKRLYVVDAARLAVNSFILATPFAIAFILAGSKKKV